MCIRDRSSNYTSGYGATRLSSGPWYAPAPTITFGSIGSFPIYEALQATFTSDTWWYIAWTVDSMTVDKSQSDVTLYAVKADGTQDWDDVVTFTNGSVLMTWGGGLTFGHESSHSADDAIDPDSDPGWRWGPVGLFNANIGVGTSGTSLRTIFEVISYP